MEMSISDITPDDILEIKQLIKQSTITISPKFTKEVLEHIYYGIALKLVKDNIIVGVWCSREFDTHTSLSYFYTDPSVRKSLSLLEFFVTAGSKVNKTKPVLISTTDTKGFDRYVEKIGDELYIFKGLR